MYGSSIFNELFETVVGLQSLGTGGVVAHMPQGRFDGQPELLELKYAGGPAGWKMSAGTLSGRCQRSRQCTML